MVGLRRLAGGAGDEHVAVLRGSDRVASKCRLGAGWRAGVGVDAGTTARLDVDVPADFRGDPEPHPLPATGWLRRDRPIPEAGDAHEAQHAADEHGADPRRLCTADEWRAFGPHHMADRELILSDWV